MSELVELFLATLEPGKVKAAESVLSKVSETPNFLCDMISLVGTKEIDLTARLAASLFLKNWVNKRWALERGAAEAISDEQKDAFRTAILGLTLSETDGGILFTNLSHCVTVISELDFPRQWSSLLPDLLTAIKHSDGDQTKLKAITETLSSVLLKYRDAVKEEDTMQELKYILDNLCEPLMSLFTHASTMMAQASNDQDRFVWSMLFQNTIEIFYTLHHVDLPEFFEDHREVFFPVFIEFLKSSRVLESSDDEDPDQGQGQKLATLMLKAMTIYAQRYESQIEPYIEAASRATISRIASDTRKSSDAMVTAGLEFLSAIAKRTWTSDYLGPLIESICQVCILPNFRLRPIDMADMEESPVDFIRSDVDGVGSDRRGSARQLVEDLNRCYEETLLGILNQHILALLGDKTGASDLHLEAAVNLVMAVAIKVSQRARGVIVTSDHINLEQFQKEHIYPILHDRANRGPLALIAALKFLYTFRNQMKDQILVEAVDLVTTLLSTTSSDPRSCVTKTYAAICLEKLLNSRHMKQTEFAVTFSGAFRLCGNQKVRECGTHALRFLIPALIANNEAIVDNEHYARLVEVLLLFSGTDIDVNILIDTIQAAITIIKRVANRPINSVFNHHCFEILAIGLGIMGKKPDAVTKFDEIDLTELIEISRDSEHDFLPYVYQILGVYIECRSSVSNVANEIYQFVLGEEKWSGGNINAVKGILNLLRAFFARYEFYSAVIDGNMAILTERLKFAFRHRKLVQEGYKLVSRMFVLLPLQLIYPVVKDIFVIIVNNLQKRRTATNIDNAFTLICSYSLRLALDDNRSAQLSFPSIINGVQRGVFRPMMDNLFVPALSRYNKINRDSLLVILGLTSLLSLGGLEAHDTESIRMGLRGLLTSLESTLQADESIDRTKRDSNDDEEIFDLRSSVHGEVGHVFGDASFSQLKNIPVTVSSKETLLRIVGPKIPELVSLAQRQVPDPMLWHVLSGDSRLCKSLIHLIQ